MLLPKSVRPRIVSMLVALLLGSLMVAGGATTAAADPPTPPVWLNPVNTHSGLCLTATDASQNYAVLQLPCNGSMAQRWQTEWGLYLMDLQFGRCLTSFDGTGWVETRECWWKKPGQVRDYHQTWDYSGNPTTFRNYGMCLGILPGNSWVRRLDCNSGPTVVWHR